MSEKDAPDDRPWIEVKITQSSPRPKDYVPSGKRGGMMMGVYEGDYPEPGSPHALRIVGPKP